jgi:hypothetical protein
MPRDCSVCSASDEMQMDVLAHHVREVSHKKISEIIKAKYKTDLSVSAIGRHLKNCTSTKEELEKSDSIKIDSSNIRENLRLILFDGVQKLLARMKEGVNEKTGYEFHLETHKCMNLFIDMVDKLLPQEPAPSEIKRERMLQSIGSLSDANKRIMYAFMTKNMTLREIRELVDEEIVKEEESEKSRKAEISQNGEVATNLNSTVSEKR